MHLMKILEDIAALAARFQFYMDYLSEYGDDTKGDVAAIQENLDELDTFMDSPESWDEETAMSYQEELDATSELACELYDAEEEEALEDAVAGATGG